VQYEVEPGETAQLLHVHLHCHGTWQHLLRERVSSPDEPSGNSTRTASGDCAIGTETAELLRSVSEFVEGASVRLNHVLGHADASTREDDRRELEEAAQALRAAIQCLDLKPEL
jgi:hypothetical protein